MFPFREPIRQFQGGALDASPSISRVVAQRNLLVLLRSHLTGIGVCVVLPS